MKPKIHVNKNNTDIYQEELSKTKTLVSVATEHLLNKSVEHYGYTNPSDELL
jgi:hypothetical protein